MDGFKCYTGKTKLGQIIYCNEQSKSNIIDAIIFALDLSTSKYMRVSNLKINRNTKECRVSIVFDNTEKDKMDMILLRLQEAWIPKVKANINLKKLKKEKYWNYK